MLGTVLGVALIVVVGLVGLGLVLLIIVTIWLVARGRSPRGPMSVREASRPVPRSMRGWQAFAVREVRRGGRRRR